MYGVNVGTKMDGHGLTGLSLEMVSNANAVDPITQAVNLWTRAKMLTAQFIYKHYIYTIYNYIYHSLWSQDLYTYMLT